MNAAYPGRVATNIWQGKSLLMKMVRPLMLRAGIDAAAGAKPGLYLALSPEVESVTGKIFDHSGPVEYSKNCLDTGLRKKLDGTEFRRREPGPLTPWIWLSCPAPLAPPCSLHPSLFTPDGHCP